MNNPMQPQSAVPDPLAHQSRARTTPTLYLVLLFGALFMWAPFAITPEVDCREYPCPLWLRGGAFLLGALFGCGALLAIVRGMVWGGRLDSTTGEIVWWHSAPGTREHRIPVAQISRIIVTHGDSVSLSLRDAAGRRIALPAECVPPPIAEWAAEVGRRFPHITIEIED